MNKDDKKTSPVQNDEGEISTGELRTFVITNDSLVLRVINDSQNANECFMFIYETSLAELAYFCCQKFVELTRRRHWRLCQLT